MQVDHLVVLYCEVMPSLLQVSYLHEVAAGQGLANVGVVVFGVEVCVAQLNANPRSNSHLGLEKWVYSQVWKVQTLVRLVSVRCFCCT